MGALLFVIIVAVVIRVFVFQDRKYRETAYYQITKNPYSSLDKGQRGEYLIYKRLQHLECDGSKFLFNIYLPKTYYETTEIDLLLICSKGLLAFESKNFSGWIFGNEAHTNWTQTFPIGKGRSHKERFYNPIMQNAAHIKHLRRFIGEKLPVRSIVVFSDECTLKDITVSSKNVSVINRYAVASVVSEICEKTQDVLSQTEINSIYNKLYPYTQVNDEEKEQHKNSTQRSQRK